MSQLSRNIATIHRNHAQTWYQQERDRQKNATGHGKKSSDAIIQFMHFCCYSMAVVVGAVLGMCGAPVVTVMIE